MLAGLISGAMAGGAKAVGELADNQIQQNARMDLSKFESQLQMDREAQLARLRQGIAREDNEYNTVGKGGENALAFSQKKVQQDARLEREAAGAYAQDPNARAGVIAKARDQHVDGAASAASAEATREDTKRKGEINKLLDQAADAEGRGDTDAAERLRKQADTKRGTVGGKTYADVVGAAKVLSAEADALVDPMKGGDPQDPAKVARAQQLRERAAELAEGLASKRGVGAGALKPGAAPYAEGTRLTGPDGKFYIVKGGKPVLEGK